MSCAKAKNKGNSKEHYLLPRRQPSGDYCSRVLQASKVQQLGQVLIKAARAKQNWTQSNMPHMQQAGILHAVAASECWAEGTRHSSWCHALRDQVRVNGLEKPRVSLLFVCNRLQVEASFKCNVHLQACTLANGPTLAASASQRLHCLACKLSAQLQLSSPGLAQSCH